MRDRRVLIVDDEPPARERLRRLVSALPGYQVCGEAGNGEEAMELATRDIPDIVLLDIRMPGKDGLEAAAHLNHLSPPPALIFCTAFDRYAIDAIRHQAGAYLLKPVRRSDLEEALERAARVNRLQEETLAAQPREEPEHLSVRTHRGVELVDLNTLYYCMADSKYVTLVHQQGETLSDYTLKELESAYPDRFLRIHRNTLVNRHYVRALLREGAGRHQVALNDPSGTRLVVSRRHVPEVRQRVDQGA